MDSISRVIPEAELNIDTTSGTRYLDALINTSIKHKENNRYFNGYGFKKHTETVV